MKARYYILDENKRVTPIDSIFEFGRWMESAEAHRVNRTELRPGVFVSTAFLGIDYSFNEGPPILWETMVFGGELDQEMNRCSGTWEQAEAMHEDMVARVEAVELLTKG